MDNPNRVRCLQPFGDLSGDVEGFVQRQWALLDALFKLTTLDQGRRQEGLAISRVNLVNRADVRMVE